MSIITMACHDTDENGRTAFTEQTLLSLAKTVNWRKHRLFIVDNNSCQKTKDLFRNYGLNDMFKGAAVLISLPENIGTAMAVNEGWRQRKPDEHCIKIDNDIVIHSNDWVEELEEVVLRASERIGQVGLKRKDCIESPHREDWYKSELIALPHELGQRHITVEKVNHVMGSCVLHSAELINRIGFLKQPGVYGFDDSFMSLRSYLAGFDNVFLPHIVIDHIDPGGDKYSRWKQDEASDKWKVYHEWVEGYTNGTIPLYFNPYE